MLVGHFGEAREVDVRDKKMVRSILLRKGLGFLVWQAVVFALAWYLHFQMNWGKYFSDILFFFGVLQLGIGLMVLLGGPSGIPGAQLATFMRRSDSGGGGAGVQSFVDLLQKRFVAIYLCASGVITFVAAAIVL